jgi:hypothetical protein
MLEAMQASRLEAPAAVVAASILAWMEGVRVAQLTKMRPSAPVRRLSSPK